MPDVVKPEIMYGDAGLGSYLKGLQVVAAVNAKKNANELQIKKLQEQIDFQQMKHDLDVEKATNTADHYEKVYDVASLNAATNTLKEQRLLSAAEDKTKQDREDTQRLIDMQSKIYGIQAKRGTTDYQKQLDDVKDQYSDVTGTAEAKRIISPLEQQHKTARLEGFKAFNNQVASLGIPSQYAPAIFATPEMWQQGDDTTDPKNPKMQFQIGASKVVIPKATYDKLKPKYQEYYGNGSATVQPPSLKERAQAALDDPDATPKEKAAAQKILATQ